ncbi:LysM peptidoglycan-binding domain-containing protein [Cellulophaga lytica]|uniref:LysM peptidoglycan-binding domain-containing protein n=1 Tax=Cellulophaga lytica TaxID=979 RepID=UPI0018DD8A5A|nr:LysM peptidoglycan-binding domain-containing protein [Cellulophaga lytica]
MNSKFFKTVLSFLLILLVTANSYAQKYKTHPVKRGESLESISKTYNVSIEDILVYNKEIKKGQKLTPNTILIVPLDKKMAAVTASLAGDKPVVEVKKVAQEEPIRFIEHKAKKRETLYSLAKQYNVTEDDIKRYNKQLYAEQLKKGTVLKIPVYKKEVVDTSVTTTTNSFSEVYEDTPYKFTNYKVKKRETLYGISKQFKVSQDQIKKYNTSLYSDDVKKGMILRIPHFKKVEIKEVVLKSYIVKAKETRWSIANKYGITVDSLLLLNPDLPKSSNYLAEGQELKIPERNIVVRDSLVKTGSEKVPDFITYTVPAKMNFYRLEKAYGVTEEKIKEINPLVKEKGLQEGMNIKIPTLKGKSSSDTQVVNSENFIFYVVRQGQGEMSLSRDLGVSFSELIAFNPALKDGIKSGMVLKLPKSRSTNFTVKNSLILPKINLVDSINVAVRPKVMVLLPFRLDKIDVNNSSTAKKDIDKRLDTKISLGFYSGMQLALETIKKKGVSVDVTAFDTQSTKSVDRVKEILAQENIANYGAIIGPLDPQSIQEVAKKTAGLQIPVVSPNLTEQQIGFGNTFYTLPSNEVLRAKILDYVSSIYTNQNIVIIADSKHKEASDAIMAKFPKAKKVSLIKDLTININKLKYLLSKKVDNFVFVETSNLALSKHATSVVNSLNAKDTKVRMFTTDLNKAFDRDDVDNLLLSNLNFTYPSVNKEITDEEFNKMYRFKFGANPNKYAARGFDIMYDVLLKLAYKNDLFEVSKIVGETEYIANKFNYVNKQNAGFTNTAVYIMQYNDMKIEEVEKVVPKV